MSFLNPHFTLTCNFLKQKPRSLFSMLKICHLLFAACLKCKCLCPMAYRALHQQARAHLISFISHCFAPWNGNCTMWSDKTCNSLNRWCCHTHLSPSTVYTAITVFSMLNYFVCACFTYFRLGNHTPRSRKSIWRMTKHSKTSVQILLSSSSSRG